MKNLKKLMVLSVTALALTACGGGSQSSSQQPSSQQPSSQPESSQPESSSEPAPGPYYPDKKPTEWKRFDDGLTYDAILGDYEELAFAAKEEKDDDTRFVKYAKAEAALMDSATFMPTTTQGGNYAMTRVAARTIPYSMWGNDTDRLKNMVVIKEGKQDKNFITSADRAAMIEKWTEARGGAYDYDPAAYLLENGYELADKYTTTFSTAPATLDVLNTSMAADTESLVNAIEGLVEYDNYGVMQPRLAKAVPAPSADGKTYTFEIRDDAKWYTADKQVYAPVTADDFVAGFQHMLDAAAGLEWLVEGVVEGVSEYLSGEVGFDEVGYKVVDNKLQITLCEETSYFLTMLTYSCFMPMNRAFFLEKGGAFGVDEFKKAKEADTYKYGDVADVNNMVYNSAFIPSKIVDKDQVLYVRNAGYYNNAKTTLNELKWVYDAGDNPTASYNTAVAGGYSGTGLAAASGTLDLAKGDGNFDKYHYVTDTNAVTYFGGFNVNRGTFDCGTVRSYKSEQEKIDYIWAMQNANFRRALQHSWDRVTFNGVSVGQDLAALSLRNIYTAPEFVGLSKDVEFEGHTFEQGSSYGDLVEYFLKEVYGREVETSDGCDGWYNVKEARKYLYAAKEELGDDWTKVYIEIECYSGSKNQVAQAQAFKDSFEKALNVVVDENGEPILKDGKEQAQDNVQINIMLAQNTTDYYAAGYRAANGEAGCFDIFYGSGWGPDYGDPSTYLDTFLGGGAGYMTKVIGLF